VPSTNVCSPTVDRYSELEDLRRSIVMLPARSPSGLDREQAIALIAELQDAHRRLGALHLTLGQALTVIEG